MKILKPLPHAIIDYAWAGTMMAAPWIFGFHKNKTATVHAVSSGAAILSLSLMTRYPLGAAKVIPFTTHGIIETVAGIATASAPWLMGFSDDENAKWTHVISGLGTLGVVAMTDYRAADRQRAGERFEPGERGAGLAEQVEGQPSKPEPEKPDLGPPTHFPERIVA